jgi:hypothetical protein
MKNTKTIIVGIAFSAMVGISSLLYGGGASSGDLCENLMCGNCSCNFNCNINNNYSQQATFKADKSKVGDPCGQTDAGKACCNYMTKGTNSE